MSSEIHAIGADRIAIENTPDGCVLLQIEDRDGRTCTVRMPPERATQISLSLAAFANIAGPQPRETEEDLYEPGRTVVTSQYLGS